MPQIYDSTNFALIPGETGGKAKGLIFLLKNKFNTPPFYLLDYNTLSGVSKGIYELDKIIEKWKNTYRIEQDSIWAVRSSADNEDGSSKSFAGLFATITNVSLQDLKDAIKKVLDSYSLRDTQKYATQKNTRFGIIIQEMIRPDYSGVIFSHNPLHLSEDTMHISIIPGLGENLVSGKEEAFQVTCKKGDFIFHNSEDIFNGQIFSDKLMDISKKGNQIKEEVGFLLPQLVKGAGTLNKLKKIPVDIEFCIEGNRIYWLQVRPITAGKETQSCVWDNTAAEGNYPGLLMPLSISIIKNSFYLAHKGMAKYIGMPESILKRNEELLQHMIGEINGGLYYNVTFWQKLVCQLPLGKRASKALPKIWGMENADFVPEKINAGFAVKLNIFLKIARSLFFIASVKKKYVANHAKVHAHFEAMDLPAKNQKELIEIYKKIETRLAGNWEAPVLNNFFTILLMIVLKRILKNSRLQLKYPNFMNDILFAQGDVISVTIIREFQSLLNDVKNEERVLNLFRSSAPPEIVQKLSESHKALFDKITDYIKKYGDRTEEPELKMETVNYKEDPLLFIAYLKNILQCDLNVQRHAIDFDYKAVLHTEYRYNPVKKAVLKLLVKQVINRIIDRENFRFMRTRTYSLVRRIFRAIDIELLKNQHISGQKDSLYLTLNELSDWNKTHEYKTIILDRKTLYRAYTASDRVTRYIQTGNAFNPVSSGSSYKNDRVITGIGCCSGIVKGPVKIIDNRYISSEGNSGIILVANYFEPGKLNLFSQASGLISVRGNLLNHTSILCREMGIPSIVGARGLLSQIKDGDVIEMNGSTGEIKLASRNE